MNLIDIVVLLVLAIMVLGGWYKGFLSSTLSVALTLAAWLLAFALLTPVSGLVEKNQDLYNMLLYYTEGSEYVAKTSVELTRVSADDVPLETLTEVIETADMPLPMGDRVAHNVAVEAFADDGYTTLGDYFNVTIVRVVINIFSLLISFVIARLLLGFIAGCVEHALGGYPALVRFDDAIGAGIGLIHGVIILFIAFLVVPVALTVLPKLYTYLEESFFGEFFYRVNPFLLTVPGT